MSAATQPLHPGQASLRGHATWVWSVLRSGRHKQALEIAHQLLPRAQGQRTFYVPYFSLSAQTIVCQFQQIPSGPAWEARVKDMFVEWAEDNWRSILRERVRADLRRAPEPFCPSIYKRRQAAHRASATYTAVLGCIIDRGVILRKGFSQWLQRYQQEQEYQQ
ncbi:hypothetical protein PspLS_10541 [Pyricularia sp. CBS 133598]|nr:hypothetical protein PspLS_10541 [Pyricularia sp. CBS 133598]